MDKKAQEDRVWADTTCQCYQSNGESCPGCQLQWNSGIQAFMCTGWPKSGQTDKVARGTMRREDLRCYWCYVEELGNPIGP